MRAIFTNTCIVRFQILILIEMKMTEDVLSVLHGENVQNSREREKILSELISSKWMRGTWQKWQATK